MGMMEWVLPREEQFFEMLVSQSGNCLEAARKFGSFIEGYSSLTKAQREAAAKRIKGIEHKGDELTHAIIDKLNKAFITPLDKEDLYELACLLDDITDYINAAALHMVLFDVRKEDKCMRALAAIGVKSAEEVHRCIIGLKGLRNVKKQHILIHSLENQGDDAYQDGLASLFRTSKDPIDIMKRREIYKLLEKVIDKCEDVANVLENIVVKHA